MSNKILSLLIFIFFSCSYNSDNSNLEGFLIEYLSNDSFQDSFYRIPIKINDKYYMITMADLRLIYPQTGLKQKDFSQKILREENLINESSILGLANFSPIDIDKKSLLFINEIESVIKKCCYTKKEDSVIVMKNDSIIDYNLVLYFFRKGYLQESDSNYLIKKCMYQSCKL